MPDKIQKKPPNAPAPDNAALFDRIVGILEDARRHVARTVNAAMVVAYWLIGREIVEEEQKGRKRAEYGKAVVEDLSARLTERYGKGFSTTSLWDFRRFYQAYPDRYPRILHPTGGESEIARKLRPTGGELGESGKGRPVDVESASGFHPDLSWSHYRALMRVENQEARLFYEQEAVRSHWKIHHPRSLRGHQGRRSLHLRGIRTAAC